MEAVKSFNTTASTRTLSGKLARFLAFLGPRVSGLSLLAVMAGATLFAVEFAMAYGMQSFLLIIGVSTDASLQLPSWIPRDTRAQVIGFLFVVASLRAALVWFQELFKTAASEGFKFQQRVRLLRWVFGSRSASSARVSTLFGERAQSAALAISYGQAAILQGVASALLGIALLVLAPWITLGLGAVGIFLAIPFRLLNRRSRRVGNELAVQWDRTNTRLMTGIKNLLLLRIYGIQDREREEAESSLKTFLRHMLSHYNASGIMLALPQVIGLALICGVTVVVGNRQMLSPGALMTYFYLLFRFVQSVTTLNGNVANSYFYYPHLLELFRWWEREYVVEHEKGIRRTAETPLPPSVGAAPSAGWKLDQVSFRFPGAVRELFDGFSLEIPPRSSVVIIGPSGVGKTTLLNLILGELVPDSGEVRVDWGGRLYPLDRVQGQFLNHIGYVGPESFLVEGTVYDNLVFGLERKPSDAEIDDALGLAECKFLKEHPDGLDQRITEQGLGLSAGQKQRISLARALLRSPSALILDEATSNLDPETEQRLIETFKHLKKSLTIVAVTHRPAFREIADQLVQLRAVETSERGSV